VGFVARTGALRHTYKILVRKRHWKTLLEAHRTLDNIKTGLRARESKNNNGNHMTRDRIHWRAVLDIVTDVTFTQKAQKILTS
jgi:hypothetical protein